MSLKSETEELLSWLATLVEKPASPDKPARTPKDTWQSVATNLDAAAKSFGTATEELDRLAEPDGVRLAAELARDLVRETIDLERRARVLGRRTAEEVEPPQTVALVQAQEERARHEAARAKAEAALAKALAEKAKVEAELAALEQRVRRAHLAGPDHEAALRAELGQELDDIAKGKAEKELKQAGTPPPTDLDIAAGRLSSGQGTLETARKKLESTDSDTTTSKFIDELDVLAEMALRLRRRCDDLARMLPQPLKEPTQEPPPSKQTAKNPAGGKSSRPVPSGAKPRQQSTGSDA
ncbi:hypothetical protein ACFQW6_07240 [Nocardioides sp. GCM10028917]|uniref:hypothetical protein n=1 Tax=Nocardioides sp. GCM10028917 TaxID=3273408 RepID=UPI00360AB225